MSRPRASRRAQLVEDVWKHAATFLDVAGLGALATAGKESQKLVSSVPADVWRANLCVLAPAIARARWSRAETGAQGDAMFKGVRAPLDRSVRSKYKIKNFYRKMRYFSISEKKCENTEIHAVTHAVTRQHMETD